MRKPTTHFSLKTTEELYEKEVLPWLNRSFAHLSRGKKKIWATRRSRPKRRQTQHPLHPIGLDPLPDHFWCSVEITGMIEAVRFALHFEEVISKSTYLPYSALSRSRQYLVDGDLSVNKSILRWLVTNVPETQWSVSGNFEGPFAIEARGDSANMALQLLIPAGRLLSVKD